MRTLFLLLLSCCLSVTAQEIILKQAPIPNRLLRQGDALLIEPAAGPRFMRIALSTRHLGKVEAKIIEGEAKNWPESPDSQAYLQVLREVCALAQQSGEKTVILTIDWHPDQVVILHQGKSYPVGNLSSDYLKQNLLLIIRDRFDLGQDAAQELLTREVQP